MYNVDWSLLAGATWQTIYMVGVAAILSVFIGGFIGILLFQISKHNARSMLYMALSFIVNIMRSVPFIILLICLIPFTRALIGSSIGSTAAIVPLTVSAIPFFARIMETALNDVAGQVGSCLFSQSMFRNLLSCLLMGLQIPGQCMIYVSN